jgi:membrane protease YdiL (CAAX protease family)
MDSRRRFHVLIRVAPGVGALVFAFVWPLVCVRATWWILNAIAFQSASAHLLAAAAIITGLSFLTMVNGSVGQLRRLASWRDTVRITALAYATFLMLAVTGGWPVHLALSRFTAATFAAGLAEEAVFRRYLPERLAGMLQRCRLNQTAMALAGVTVSQLSFAVAHAQNSTFAGAGGREFIVLFLGGMLYFAVARTEGLWAAGGLHGAINLMIAFAARAP